MPRVLFLWGLLWIQWPDLPAALTAHVPIDPAGVGLDLFREQGHVLR